MRTRLAWLVRAALSLGLVAWALPASGRADRLEPFDQAIRDAYFQIVRSRQSEKSNDKPRPRRKDILLTSDRVFAGSPDAERELGHLRRFVAEQVSAEAGEPDQAAPARDLLAPDDSGLADLVGISVFWHEAQRRYDREAGYQRGVAHMGLELPMPIEMEQRGWQAGCSFWKAGVAALLRPTAGDWPGSYYCEGKFPPAYYCRLYFSVEIVLLTAEQLRTSGISRAQVVSDISGANPSGTPFERVLSAYCGEYERAEKGNPLDLRGFTFQWGADECLDRALKTALDPRWKASTEMCALEHPPGADIRAAARGLKDWK